MTFHTSLVSSFFNIPSSWLASPAALLTNLVIPFILVAGGVYYFLYKMHIFGYNSTVYVVLSGVISFALTVFGRVGMIGGIISGLYLLFFELRTNIFVKILILIGFLVGIFYLIPKLS